MLERPDLEDDRIIDCLKADYGLHVSRLAFRPLGADMNTAVYRAETVDNGSFFVKLRAGQFDQNTVLVPYFLHETGIRPIIPPLKSTQGRLWVELKPFNLILYPFVPGRDGYEVELAPGQWREFGAALRAIHATSLPASLASTVPRESYSPIWRDTLLRILELARNSTYPDDVARKLAAFLNAKRAVIHLLVEHAGRLARTIQQRHLEYVLCHTDLHAGNIFIGDDGTLHIVDWDNPLFAPKEHDLMFIGGAQGFIASSPEEEESYFYQGYGAVVIDPEALAYYRFERIIEDIAVFGHQLLLSDAGGADRERALGFLMSNFNAGGTITAAYRAIGAIT